MILVIGAIFGSIADYDNSVSQTVNYVVGLDPHAMLQVFLPALIFESAFNSNGFILNRSKWQILMMAGPGVLVTAGLIAIVILYVLGYSDDLDWPQALVIGSILATTDPVAVVALLKELGTSVKFNTLLEGESLLNDGTAFVFFLVCLDIVKTGEFNIGKAVIQFMRLTFGGPALGVAIAFLVALWLRHIVKDTVLGVVITFFGVYVCFFLSESVLHVSGILALVALGFYLGTYGKVNMTENMEHAIHTVWSFLAWVLETGLFMISGMYIGDKLINYKSHTDDTEFGSLYGSDIWKILLFYVILFIIRFLVTLAMSPLLNCMGYPVTFKAVIVITWGGLRGAIALALAMIVMVDHDVKSDRFKDLC